MWGGACEEVGVGRWVWEVGVGRWVWGGGCWEVGVGRWVWGGTCGEVSGRWCGCGQVGVGKWVWVREGGCGFGEVAVVIGR